MLSQLPKSILDEVGFPALPSAAACHQLALQYQLEASQWEPQDILLQNQYEQVAKVIKHAYTTVPYYQKLFEKIGLTVDLKLDTTRLQDIPISRREMIQEAGDTLRSDSLPKTHGKSHSIATSGSTGRPVRMLGTAVTRFFWRAFVLREHAWHRRDLTRKLGIIRWAKRDVGAAPTGMRAPTWPIAGSIFQTGPSCMLNVVTPITEQIAWLQKEQPHYLLSYPSNFSALANYCLEHDISLPYLSEVRTIGEMLTTQQRALFQRAWGVRTVDLYTCEEAGYLAVQCPLHDHYHVQSENVLLEIVDENGQHCAPHQTGRVLITTLHNFATPLIRYEIGDFAQFGDPCSCGRGLPVIKKINGRKRNRLIMPDGRSEFPYLGEHGQIQALTGLAVHQIQFIQHSVEEVEVKLVTERPFNARETDAVTSQVQKNLGHPFRIRFSHCTEISKGPTGKFDEFISTVIL